MQELEWWIWPIFLYSFGILAAIDALWQGRTSQGTIAWVLALLLMPALSLPFYLFFGSRRFQAYRRARRHGDDRISATECQARNVLAAHKCSMNPITKPLEKLFRIGQLNGNHCDILTTGNETYNAILNSMQCAQQTLCVQFYTFRDDQVGQRFADVMCEKAASGVRVYLLYDELGSGGLDDEFLHRLIASGVEVSRFNPIKLRNRTHLNFRNHRKIVVIDGQVTYTGGYNIGEEYLGLNQEIGRWRDTHMCISGPASLAFQLSFTEDWHWATGVEPKLNWDMPSVFGAQKVMCINSGPADFYESGSLFFTHLIHQAKERCWLVSPYFVPDQTVFSALQLAALRGVDIRILLPGQSDSWLVTQATREYVQILKRSGIQFFTYDDGFLHQKVALIDDEWACVGSANLDNRSLRINFEANALVQDHDFARKIEIMLLEDFQHSHPTLVDSRWHKQLLGKICRLMAPLL
jgi:cardiolipin synthase